MTKNKIHIPLMYGYYGASNLYVRIEVKEGGIVEAFNDWDEKMFKGFTEELIDFLGELKKGKYAK